MVNKVLEYVRKYRMIVPGDHIVAGVSGGADSVCLLFLLIEMKRQIPFEVRVVHINHGIREEAARDACFVEKLCNRQGIPFTLVEADVRESARGQGLSEEEEGRRIRYQAFERALGADQGKIAVAHNSNDRAETMLFHLFRGTGLAGAGGIRPVSGKIIRPLLCLQRWEIESWLAERAIPFCQDETNEQDVYTRNRIRHHILPYAEQEICRGTIAHMNQAADQLQAAEEYIRRQTQAALSRCVELDDGHQQGRRVIIRLAEFFREDGYLRGRILLECLERAAGSRKNITAAHIGGIERLLKGTGSGEMHLPYGLVVYREYDLGMIQKRRCQGQKKRTEESSEYEVHPPGTVEVPGLGRVEFTVFSRQDSQIIPEKTYTKWFDYDKITSVLAFRTRRQGDYLAVNSKMGHKSLQDYFVNEKIPRREREKIYLLAEGAHVMWIPGHRISEYYKVTEGTGRILQVSVPGGDR